MNISNFALPLYLSDAIFGAFLFGLIMPRDSHLFKECNEKIEELVLSLTLPLYFALSGLKTDVTQINTGAQGAMVILVCAVATIGKVNKKEGGREINRERSHFCSSSSLIIFIISILCDTSFATARRSSKNPKKILITNILDLFSITFSHFSFYL